MRRPARLAVSPSAIAGRNRGGIAGRARRSRDQAAGRGRRRGGSRAGGRGRSQGARPLARIAARDPTIRASVTAVAEREISQHAARLSALTEAKTRLRRQPRGGLAARGTRRKARCASLRRRPNLKASSIPCAPKSTATASQLAEVRAEAQALAREAEIARKRLEAIAGEQKSWVETKDRTAAQIATLEARVDRNHRRARRPCQYAAGLCGQARGADHRGRSRREDPPRVR